MNIAFSSTIITLSDSLPNFIFFQNSIQVVSHELERLAKRRWEDAASQGNVNRFERFRAIAHGNLGMSQ